MACARVMMGVMTMIKRVRSRATVTSRIGTAVCSECGGYSACCTSCSAREAKTSTAAWEKSSSSAWRESSTWASSGTTTRVARTSWPWSEPSTIAPASTKSTRRRSISTTRKSSTTTPAATTSPASSTSPAPSVTSSSPTTQIRHSKKIGRNFLKKIRMANKSRSHWQEKREGSSKLMTNLSSFLEDFDEIPCFLGIFDSKERISHSFLASSTSPANAMNIILTVSRCKAKQESESKKKRVKEKAQGNQGEREGERGTEQVSQGERTRSNGQGKEKIKKRNGMWDLHGSETSRCPKANPQETNKKEEKREEREKNGTITERKSKFTTAVISCTSSPRAATSVAMRSELRPDLNSERTQSRSCWLWTKKDYEWMSDDDVEEEGERNENDDDGRSSRRRRKRRRINAKCERNNEETDNKFTPKICSNLIPVNRKGRITVRSHISSQLISNTLCINKNQNFTSFQMLLQQTIQPVTNKHEYKACSIYKERKEPKMEQERILGFFVKRFDHNDVLFNLTEGKWKRTKGHSIRERT